MFKQFLLEIKVHMHYKSTTDIHDTCTYIFVVLLTVSYSNKMPINGLTKLYKVHTHKKGTKGEMLKIENMLF
jgi:hypothetical protein